MINLENLIEYTNLKIDVTQREIETLCDEVLEFNFNSLCISPCYVKIVKEKLKNKKKLVCSVISFPLGISLTNVKIFEIKELLKFNIDKLDIVLKIVDIKENNLINLKKEVKEILNYISEPDKLRFVIDMCFLKEIEIIKLCEYLLSENCNSIVTSTGFGNRGVNAKDIRIIKSNFGNKIKIKATGGIKHIEEAILMINSGADIIGTSNAVRIIKANKNLIY
jgi:deoxyribose-phosphate aldolase